MRKRKSVPLFLLIAGCLGLMLWSVFSHRNEEVPAMQQQRFHAIASAKQALVDFGWQTEPNLHITANVLRNSMDSTVYVMDYIWKSQGRERFHNLLGKYLFPTGWIVLLADSQATYTVYLDETGKAFRIQVNLPDSYPFIAVNEVTASHTAFSFATQALGITPGQLKALQVKTTTPGHAIYIFDDKHILSQVKSTPDVDTYIFEDTSIASQTGEKYCVEVDMTGDKVTDLRRIIKFPTAVKQQFMHEHNILSMVKLIASLLIGLILVLGVYLGIQKWRQGAFDKRSMLQHFIFITLSSLIIRLCSIPSDLSLMQPDKSLLAQWLPSAIRYIVWAVVYGFAIGMAAGFIKEWKLSQLAADRRESIWGALGIGGIVLGFVTAAYVLMPEQNLHMPDVTNAASLYPAIVQALKTGILFVTVNTVISIVLYSFEIMTDSWKRKHLEGILWLTVNGAIAACFFGLKGIALPDIMWTIVYAAFTMIVLLTAYLMVLRYDFRMLSLSLFIVMTGNAVNFAVIHPYPNSLQGSILSIMLMFAGLILIMYHNKLLPKSTSAESRNE